MSCEKVQSDFKTETKEKINKYLSRFLKVFMKTDHMLERD